MTGVGRVALLFCLSWCLLSVSVKGQGVRVAFYNVENFFDTRHDTLKVDYEFTPEGKNHWTRSRMERKRDGIYKVLVGMKSPAIVGLAEVENDYVLGELCKATPLRKNKYAYLHYDSPDVRGVDCALLYRTDMASCLWSRAICVSDSARNFFTRDLLLAAFVLNRGDTAYVLVCHLPSKLGGSLAEQHRREIAGVMRVTADSLASRYPEAHVVVMGDMNAYPDELCIAEPWGFDSASVNRSGFENLMIGLSNAEGTHNYQGAWGCLDQIFVRLPDSVKASGKRVSAKVYDADFLLEKDEKHLTSRPFRTYSGPKYLGGFSDHLPVYVDLP